MAEILTFTLWAPLASMGDIAVGERRVGGGRPARSAVLGLVAAALGVDRRDAERLRAIELGYGVAMLVERPGTLLQDYHSTQLPKNPKRGPWATRAHELARPVREINTILTLREYRCDPWVEVALWERAGAPYPLPDIARRLERPGYTLHFGRKACPLGLPPSPRVCVAESLVEAFRQCDRKRPESERRMRRILRIDGPGTLYADTDAREPEGPGLGGKLVRIEPRRDAVVSRRRWQFGLRDELVARPLGAG